MRKLIILLMAVLLFIQFGCAAGFRVGGQRCGVGADAAIGQDPMLVTPER